MLSFFLFFLLGNVFIGVDITPIFFFQLKKENITLEETN
jgi:hypothetical protein